MALELNKILTAIKAAKNESEVRSVAVDSEEVFTQEEQNLFITSRIKSVDDAKKVAELLAKIKVALEKKEKDDALMDELEQERDAENFRGSMVYRVLNVNNLVRNATDFLTFLSTGVPKGKEERKKKKERLEKEINEKRAELTLNNSGLSPLESKYQAALEDAQEAKEGLARRESLYEVLSGDPNSDFKITHNGTKKAISSITLNITDYSGNKLWDESARGTKPNISLQQALKNADTFLVSMTTDTMGVNQGKSFKYAKGKGNYFNGRVYQSKQALSSVQNNIGYGILLALREFGTEKLKKIIVASGATGTKKDKLDKFVERIEKCIDFVEEIGGINYDSSNWTVKYDEWQRSLLTKKIDDFPYVPAVNYNDYFEFMTTVFPFTVNSAGEYVLNSKPYLDNKSDQNYLAPVDPKKGWEGKIWLKGYSSKPIDGKNITYFSKQSGTSPKIADELANANKIPSDWDFATIVKLWYDCFDPFVDFTRNDWKTAYNENGNKIVEEEFLENSRCQLRFCLTMQEILKELGLSKDIHDFNDYLLEIADRAEKDKTIGRDRKLLVEQLGIKAALASSSTGVRSNDKSAGTTSALVLKQIAEGKVWALDYTQSRSVVLRGLIDSSKGVVTILEGKADALKTQIGVIEENNANIIFEINRKKRELQDLKDVDDFDDAPTPDKKKIFEDLYKKKDTQGGKWLYLDVKKMVENYLPTIKLAMNDDVAYKSEGFEDKETELKGIVDKVKPLLGEIGSSWEIFLHKTKNKTPSETINLILKSKDDEVSGKAELEKIKGFYEQMANEVILEEGDEANKKKIIEAITDPIKFKDTPPIKTKFDPDSFKAFFKIDNTDQALVDKWKDLDKTKVEKALKDYVVGGTKLPGLISHLNEKGAYDKDNKDSEKKITETDPKKFLEKFLKDSTAEAVVKTIVVHENDDALRVDNPDKAKKTALIKQMREDSEAGYNKDDETKNFFDKGRYGNPTEGKEDNVTREQIVNYLYDKKLESVQKSATTWKTDEGGNGNDNGDNKPNWYEWASPIGKTIYITGGILLVAGIAAFIFWNQISEWWNGPVEEQGEGKVDGEEKEEEEDR